MEAKLEFIKDYQYQFEEEDSIETIDILKCSNCGCIHYEDDVKYFYQFLVGEESPKDTVAGWATDHNKKELV